MSATAATEGDRGDLNELVATMMDALLRFMGTDHLEIEGEKGVMRRWHRHDRGGRDGLARTAESPR